MQKIKLSDEAEQDLMESFDWYETQKVGLGELFLESIQASLYVVQQSPRGFRVVFKSKVRESHRCAERLSYAQKS